MARQPIRGRAARNLLQKHRLNVHTEKRREILAERTSPPVIGICARINFWRSRQSVFAISTCSRRPSRDLQTRRAQGADSNPRRLVSNMAAAALAPTIPGWTRVGPRRGSPRADRRLVRADATRLASTPRPSPRAAATPARGPRPRRRRNLSPRPRRGPSSRRSRPRPWRPPPRGGPPARRRTRATRRRSPPGRHYSS